MYLEEPDYELRDALKFKYGNIEFFTDFRIDAIYVYYLKKDDKYQKVICLKPMFIKKKTRDVFVIGVGSYFKSFDIAKIKEMMTIKNQFLKSYKEPYPGYYHNDKPWLNSRKKQKPNKRR